MCDGSADSDSSDGKKLIPAQLKVTDPTVTVRETESLKNIENTGFCENDKISEGDGNLQNSDGKTSEKSRREKGVIKPRKSRGSKSKSKKGARRKARRKAKNKR